MVTADADVAPITGAVVPADIAGLLAAVSDGDGSHDALVSLAGKFAAQGVAVEAVEEILLDAADQRPEAGRDPGWIRMRADIPRILDWAYRKEADAQGHLTAALTSAARRAHAGNGNGAAPIVVPIIPTVGDPDAGLRCWRWRRRGIRGGGGGGGSGPGPGATPGGPQPAPGAGGATAAARG